MTDPIVKQALLDLVDTIRTLTTLVDRMNKRLYEVEDRLDNMPDYELGGEDA